MNPVEVVSDVIEHVKGMWRFRWLAVLATWAVSIAGWLYVYSLPDVYRASARVYVDTNSLLKPLMQGLTAPQDTMSEVQLVSTAVLTRPNLEFVARETDLDLRTSNQEQFERLITALQTRITVSRGGDNIFRIQYEDSNRDKAREVVAAVLDTFVEDAIDAQGSDADITERALRSEITEHEQRLGAAESALADFKRRNIGYMPGESGGYYESLQSALNAVSAADEKVRRLEERRNELSRQISGESPVFGIVPSSGQGAYAGCSQAPQLMQLESELSQLAVNFTERHPRVLTLKETIAVLEERCTAEKASSSIASLSSAAAGDEALEANPVYQNLRIQLSNAELEIVDARAALRSNEASVAQLRRDVDKIAEVETQLKQLNRDYNVISSRHQELLKRWEDLQAKKRLDPVTDHVQFRRIEPPFASDEPIGPDRPTLLVGVLMASIAAGGGLIFALNQVRPVFFSRRSILKRMPGLPVLGVVTQLASASNVVRRRIGVMLWTTAYATLLLVSVAIIKFSPDVARLLHGVIGGGA